MKDDQGVQWSLQLSLTQRQEIFEAEIIPAIGAHGPPVEKPTFAVVSGQPGAGKSTMIRQLGSKFGGQTTQQIIADDLNAYIPGNNAALLKGSHALEQKNSSAVTEWYHQLFDRSIEKKYNIILESCYSPRQYVSLLNAACSNGYKTELYIIATDRITSFTSIHDRFEKALKNGFLASTVLPDADAHNHYYSIWPRVAFEVENNKLFDRIAIVRRNGKTVFENAQVAENDGESNWKQGPAALRALMNVRNQPLDNNQQQWVRSVWDRLAKSSAFAQHPDSANVPVVSYRRDVASSLREHSDLNSRQPRAEYLRDFSEKFSRNLQRDVELIGSHKSRRNEFQEETFEQIFSEKIKSVHRSLKEAITTRFAAAIAEPNEAKEAHVRDRSALIGRDSAETAGTTKRLKIGGDQRTIAATTEVVQIHEQQAQSVNHQRPKFLVEVSKYVYRPIEEYDRMVFDRARFPNLNRNRGKLNVLIRLEGDNGYETPASLKARLGQEKSNLFAKTMNEGRLPHDLASRTTGDLPMVLADVGNGKTFVAGEKFFLLENGRRIPKAISADRILVRNENGNFSELSQRLAESTERTLPSDVMVQLGLQPERVVGSISVRGTPFELDQRARGNSHGRA
ncbi:hypothetical protein G6M87_32445 (plasmid) [Rhizobium rhizogenes]|uniref:zeta toxin family protein n=1 Tax=Rhizobium rhizogenes TaxID=359 RepID=UPI001573324E|nr:zeta toxin family protein [Rhizobium rhizogenes]NTI26865.1 hypothetical protein [Rhizobium rhizogenes]QTG10254.1 hypothetical protein G6M87_32445 [Rhizobium rhizogenes]